MAQVVLIRHGQSTWNKENKFTGWYDCPLSEQGEAEAHAAGEILRREGFHFDVAYTSLLKRAIKTLWIALEEMDQMWIPVHNAWQLNERHYGALQGSNKKEQARIHGEDQVLIWRRSFDVPPPALTKDSPHYPVGDPRYANVDEAALPLSESLKDTIDRVLPYWNQVIKPDVEAGRKVVICAHGNSLRALLKHLGKISEEEIVGLNIPTGIPQVLELDPQMSLIERRYLGSPEDLEKALNTVKAQSEISKTG